MGDGGGGGGGERAEGRRASGRRQGLTSKRQPAAHPCLTHINRSIQALPSTFSDVLHPLNPSFFSMSLPSTSSMVVSRASTAARSRLSRPARSCTGGHRGRAAGVGWSGFAASPAATTSHFAAAAGAACRDQGHRGAHTTKSAFSAAGSASQRSCSCILRCRLRSLPLPTQPRSGCSLKYRCMPCRQAGRQESGKSWSKGQRSLGSTAQGQGWREGQGLRAALTACVLRSFAMVPALPRNTSAVRGWGGLALEIELKIFPHLSSVPSQRPTAGWPSGSSTLLFMHRQCQRGSTGRLGTLPRAQPFFTA